MSMGISISMIDRFMRYGLKLSLCPLAELRPVERRLYKYTVRSLVLAFQMMLRLIVALSLHPPWGVWTELIIVF